MKPSLTKEIIIVPSLGRARSTIVCAELITIPKQLPRSNKWLLIISAPESGPVLRGRLGRSPQSPANQELPPGSLLPLPAAQLQQEACPSGCLSVRVSVRPSVRLSVGFDLCSRKQLTQPLPHIVVYVCVPLCACVRVRAFVHATGHTHAFIVFVCMKPNCICLF